MKIFVACLTCLSVFTLSLGFSTVYAQTPILQFDPDTIVTGHTSVISCIGCSGSGPIAVDLFKGGAGPIPIILNLVLGSNPPIFLSDPIAFTDAKGTIITVNATGITPVSTTIEPNFVSLLDDSANYNKNKKLISILTTTCSGTITGGDLDGDMICDNWETPALFPTDTICSGQQGLCIRTSSTSPIYFLGCDPTSTLATDWSDMCPNPNKTDIYYELDFMAGHKPKQSAIDNVSIAFATSEYLPNTNPNVLSGVNLHVQLDEKLPHMTTLSSAGSGASPGFDQIKYWHFGTPTERGTGYNVDTNTETGSWGASTPTMRNVKAQVFHYIVFGHNLPSCTGISCSSGHAEIPGNDAFVTLGSFDNMIGTLDQQEGTLMHEIGHNTNLMHGGNSVSNCSPNYLSIMSYSRQFSDFISDRPLDFSHSLILPALNENSLSESAGVGTSTPAGLRTVYGPLPPLVRETGQAFDWNRDGDFTDSGVVNDINNLGFAGCGASPGQTLNGFKDWDPTRLKITARVGFGTWQD